MGDISDDHLDDILEYMASQGWAPRSKVYGPPLQCNRCGDRNVYWQRVRGKYFLCNTETIAPHVCQPTPEGFDDVE